MNIFKRLLCLALCAVMAVGSLCLADAAAFNEETLELDGNWVAGYMSSSNDSDYYKIVMPSDGNVELKLMHYMTVNWQLLDEDLAKIDSYTAYDGTSTSPKTHTFNFVLCAGTYYFRVYQFGDYSGDYNIKGEFTSYGCDSDEPTSYATAKYLEPGKAAVGCFTITNEGDDWYRIEVEPDCRVTIQIKHCGSVDYGLYNADLEKIEYSALYDGSIESPKTHTLTFDLKQGTYYIEVDFHGFYIPYEISHTQKIYTAAPKNFTVVKTTTKTAKVKWDKNDAQGYQVQYKVGGKWKVAGTTKKGTFTVKNLTSAKKYVFRVRGFKKYNGKTYYGEWSDKKEMVTLPEKVTLVSAKSPQTRYISASWKKVSGAEGYQVYYSTDKKFNGYSSYTVVGGSKKSFSLGWVYGKKYFIKVRAYKKCGYTTYYGAWSNVKSTTVKGN